MNGLGFDLLLAGLGVGCVILSILAGIGVLIALTSLARPRDCDAPAADPTATRPMGWRVNRRKVYERQDGKEGSRLGTE